MPEECVRVKRDLVIWQKIPIDIPEVHAADKSDQCLRLCFVFFGIGIRKCKSVVMQLVSHTIENTL